MPKLNMNLAHYILVAVIAVLGFLTGMTDPGKSVQVALDKDKAIVQATQLLNETPQAEVEKAVADDKASQ